VKVIWTVKVSFVKAISVVYVVRIVVEIIWSVNMGNVILEHLNVFLKNLGKCVTIIRIVNPIFVKIVDVNPAKEVFALMPSIARVVAFALG
jgi:hypothetical protein